MFDSLKGMFDSLKVSDEPGERCSSCDNPLLDRKAPFGIGGNYSHISFPTKRDVVVRATPGEQALGMIFARVCRHFERDVGRYPVPVTTLAQTVEIMSSHVAR